MPLAPQKAPNEIRSLEASSNAPVVENDLSTLGERRTPSFKRRALFAAQRALYRSGMASAYATVAHPARAAILMYHSVARPDDERSIAPGNRVREADFENHCRFLAEHRNVLSLDDLLDRCEHGRPIPRRAVVITFDDGYRDTLEVAAPILERYDLPATLYLATGYVDRCRNQWEDELYAAYRFAAELPENPAQSYAAEASELLAGSMDARDRRLESIRARLQPTRPPKRTTLTWDEVRELDVRFPQIVLGVHTDEHVDLAALPTERALAHVSASADRFQRELGRRPSHFAFPYCRVHADVLRALPRLGLRSAATSIGIVNTSRAGCAWDLQRVEAHESLDTIAYWTSGAHPDLSKRLFGRA
jgi:peptidoglycan/xylan/chitin deacetylase (PgdA/CDA1 family)